MLFETTLTDLEQYIAQEKYKGYDPYDGLTSPLNFKMLGGWFAMIVMQIQKRNPINIRPLLGIKKGYNPKAIGLFLNGYSNLYKFTQKKEYKDIADELFDWLINNYSKGYHGYCWGYNFDWASAQKYLPAFTPTVVVSSFVAKGIYNYYSTFKNPKAPEVLKGICDFILQDLPKLETDEGICYSYSPLIKDCCYNASLLGAETLGKYYSISKSENLLELIEGAMNFVLVRQHDDGHWNYSQDSTTGVERKQIDFHQGYVLDSIFNCLKNFKTPDPKYLNSIRMGASYYKKIQFFENGCSKWRIPKVWPVEIHNQAQGIITFTRLREFDSEYLSFAGKIADWTIENMRDEKGYFYYRKCRYYTNKIPYIRWSQAWIFLALTKLLLGLKSDDRNK